VGTFSGMQRSLSVVALVFAFGACRDVEVTAPEADAPDAPPPCTTPDCATFRSLSTTQVASLVSTSLTIVTTGIDNASTASRIALQLNRLRTAHANGNMNDARASLLAALVEIDNAIADPSQRGDLPDLTAIRLNLEPLIVNLGLR
jgi:hypothetical protein